MAAVACINAVVGGVAVALALRWLLAASVPRFRGAAAVVPELYEGPSPGMPGWTERADRREA
jgi:hypothetical protein